MSSASVALTRQRSARHTTAPNLVPCVWREKRRKELQEPVESEGLGRPYYPRNTQQRSPPDGQRASQQRHVARSCCPSRHPGDKGEELIRALEGSSLCA